MERIDARCVEVAEERVCLGNGSGEEGDSTFKLWGWFRNFGIGILGVEESELNTSAWERSNYI